MKDQVLKLCRRLKQCTLDDLFQFLEADEVEIETILLLLEQENLIEVKDKKISLTENKKTLNTIDNKNLELMFQFRADEEIEIIIKGFCSEILPTKLCYLVNVQTNCICKYYSVFRKLIYEHQLKELMHLFFEKPQIGRYRKFYEKYAYFYVYKNQVFVSDKLLRAKLEKNYTKEEVREFKRIYSYLSRIESHNINEKYMYYRLAEYIWRRNKSFDELYKSLKNMINS